MSDHEVPVQSLKPELENLGSFPLDMLGSLKKYFEWHEAETSEELEEELFDNICHHAQTLWFDDSREVEKWVSNYGLVKAMRQTMREYGVSYDTV